ncbi:MAG: TonB-dependent receptor [Polyangiaceae bacterium]
MKTRVARVAAAALASAWTALPCLADDGIDVTVEGALAPRATEEAVASSVLKGEELEAPGASIADVIARTPSVRLTRTGSSADVTTAGLRGASTAETPVYLGGVRLNDEVSGAADLSLVPLFWLKRIELYRGNGPVELGTVGLGGAISLVPGLPIDDELRFGAGYGSFGEHSLFVAGAGGTEAARAGIALRYQGGSNDFGFVDDRGTRFDASDDVARTRRNADASVGEVFSIGRAELGDRGSMKFVFNTLSREQGVTGLGIVPALHSRATTRRNLGSISATVRCGTEPDDETCALESTVFAKVTSYFLRDPSLELPFGTPALVVDAAEGGARLVFHAEPWRWAAIDAGADQIFDQLAVDPDGPVDGRAHRSSSRAFATAKVTPFEDRRKLSFDLAISIGSARGGASLFAFADADAKKPPNLTFLTPEVRGGVRWQPVRGFDVYASGARYVRLPTLGESYGASETVLGNPELLPERGPSVEAGANLDRKFGKVGLALGGTFFARFASDLISYKRTSFAILRPFNVGSARVLGGEFTGAFAFKKIVRVDGSFTVTDARGSDEAEHLEDARLPFVATYAGSAGLHLAWDRPKGSALQRAAIGTTFVYRSARPGDGAGLIVLPAQLLWDADAALELAGGAVTLRGRVANLLDDRTTDAVGYPLPGRAFYLSTETVMQ